jgi:hypothetical protein
LQRKVHGKAIARQVIAVRHDDTDLGIEVELPDLITGVDSERCQGNEANQGETFHHEAP